MVCAFLRCTKAAAGELQSEVRPASVTTDPRSGEPVSGIPRAILWHGEQPVAALIGTVVLVNRAARLIEHRRLVAAEAERRGHEVQHVREPDLWRLAA